ncbi:PAS domain-containing sensor histidine kinase [Desulfoluna sp.]|uniref:sensor histidine kinase n=1 Tax=Desulfoluna sp. TaxID=2045199 RepID=UPI00262A49F2|nr:PAS domain-containing sensor histidine kinase [Desulfoluna sp.]
MWTIHNLITHIDNLFSRSADAPGHYRILTRNIIITMLVVTITPLTVMGILNHFQYGRHLQNELITPLANTANKAKHSFELFFEERLSTVRFIANAYDYEELLDDKTLHRLLRILKTELGGFVDLAIINDDGDLVNYAGPYNLLGKNYASQRSFQEVLVKGSYISNVFMGHRKLPHIVVAVQRYTDEGTSWIVRATIDTDRFYKLLGTLGLSPQSDAFLVNSDNILQTNSTFYGKTLETCRLTIPSGMRSTFVTETTDPDNRQLLLACSGFTNADYVLVIAKPRSVVLRSWYALKSDALLVYTLSLLVIIFMVVKMTGTLVRRIKESDERRETALTELQHNQKLSSIGRLAAGVAHEINNPLAIINEKAGLMSDLVMVSDDFPHKERLSELTAAIIASVSRCKTITHRLLGFARKLDTLMESLDINEILKEVMGFLEREALYRQMDVSLNLDPTLAPILSDRGQLQQVFLNLLTNAFSAVDDGGTVLIASAPAPDGGLSVTVQDNGCGMTEDVAKRIFDPFFSTKKGNGTGLGLSITYGIIKKLGGAITLNTRQGEGTTFTVTLPKNPPADKTKGDPTP